MAPGLRVKAQPMVRDEQAGLWGRLKNQHLDTLSIVTIELCEGQYAIVAHSIADSKVSICVYISITCGCVTSDVK